MFSLPVWVPVCHLLTVPRLRVRSRWVGVRLVLGRGSGVELGNEYGPITESHGKNEGKRRELEGREEEPESGDAGGGSSVGVDLIKSSVDRVGGEGWLRV